MSGLKLFGTAFLLWASLGLVSCTRAGEMQNSSAKETNIKNKSFDQHHQEAGHFVELMEKGIALKEKGLYREAIEHFQKAYKNAAFGKIELTMALKKMGETYELMNDYELAANFYEAAGKEAMHPMNAEAYQVKADELRKKAKLHPLS